jgi:SAM-dependent methyltransferase
VVRLTARLVDPVIWHDVECGGYEADLMLWRELADSADGPVLEIGCGTGRVALDLVARGHDVTAFDSDPALIRALDQRARERGARVATAVADARTFDLRGRRFALAIAPMQVVQLMGGREARGAMLERVREHLAPGGVLAAALADPFEGEPPDDAGPPLPDVREQDGWVFSSTPIAVRSEEGGTAIDRVRQAVSPDGELDESMATIVLDALSPDELEADAEAAGLRPLRRRHVPPSDDYVGSVVAVLELR